MVCFVVVIFNQPENTTACRGSNVTISCGYVSADVYPVTWMINETLFDEETLENSRLYQLNYLTEPLHYSLTVYSINGTTTFQCIVQFATDIISTPGTVTVIGMYIGTYMYLMIFCI